MKKSNQEIKLFVLCGFLIALLFAAPMGGKLYTKWRTNQEKAALLAKVQEQRARRQAEVEKILTETKLEPMVNTFLTDGLKWPTINFKSVYSKS